MSDLLPESVIALLWQIPFAVLVAYLYYRIDRTWRQYHQRESERWDSHHNAEMEKWRQFHKEESERWQLLISERDRREEELLADMAEIIKANTVALRVNGVVEELKEEIRRQQNGG